MFNGRDFEYQIWISCTSWARAERATCIARAAQVLCIEGIDWFITPERYVVHFYVRKRTGSFANASPLTTFITGTDYDRLYQKSKEKVYLDRRKPITLPESTETGSLPYRTEPYANISPSQLPEISHWFDIKSIISSVSFCQSHEAFVCHKTTVPFKVNYHSTVSTRVRSYRDEAAKSD